MSYEAAKLKAWEELRNLNPAKSLAVKFLAEEYSIDLQNQVVMSLSCNVPAKDFYCILILHYAVKKLQGLPAVIGEWLTFRELSGIEGYFEAFKKRAIEPIIRKYGHKVEDTVIEVITFEGVPALVKVWKSDEDFGPDANIYFDRSIREIFCTEDIVVLAGIIASSL
ncbi:MAG: DUF3786 domain-containing protein [Candidatus Omnitrophica bacterium]|nr:DUF3786 domain-containing protein [Candidatus Omnitrophota bacterium]